LLLSCAFGNLEASSEFKPQPRNLKPDLRRQPFPANAVKGFPEPFVINPVSMLRS
jgi:hypothetical protein